MIGSFVPTWYIARALAHILSIPDDVPVRDQPFGLLWLVLFLITMATLVWVGLGLSLLLDAAILRFFFGRSWLMAAQEIGLNTSLWLPWLWGVKRALSGSEQRDPKADPMYDPLLDDPVWF
jgi:hypothetical protein